MLGTPRKLHRISSIFRFADLVFWFKVICIYNLNTCLWFHKQICTTSFALVLIRVIFFLVTSCMGRLQFCALSLYIVCARAKRALARAFFVFSSFFPPFFFLFFSFFSFFTAAWPVCGCDARWLGFAFARALRGDGGARSSVRGRLRAYLM